ncbi:MAG: vitamin B12 dependent methionine synthase [Candidatus Omnitrophica bacterium]|nr:vitamin B12 dependent methionine synthase [Candidatus Omnitrophota bacterium]
MELKVFPEIKFSLDRAALLKKVRIDPESEQAGEILALAEQVEKIARPKALYAVAYVEEKREETVRIDKITFTSRVLSVNLKKVNRVFPYICTCGSEIDQAGMGGNDVLLRFWVEAIKEMALASARTFLANHLQKSYGLNSLAFMSPGHSAKDVWPIEQQKLLFSLLGDVKGLIGVELTSSCLMLPTKTVSGIFFPTRIDYQACRLCQRENCPGRVVAYDASFARSYRMK